MFSFKFKVIIKVDIIDRQQLAYKRSVLYNVKPPKNKKHEELRFLEQRRNQIWHACILDQNISLARVSKQREKIGKERGKRWGTHLLGVGGDP